MSTHLAKYPCPKPLATSIVLHCYSIDPTTEVTIQRVIREGFVGRTTIMIAHRLQSLIEFETVMVLESGCLAEIGPPKSLLQDSSSKFSALYRAGGYEK